MKWAVLLLAACGHKGGEAAEVVGSGSGAIDRAAAKSLFTEIQVATPPGMSGLAVDDHDVIWGVPERDHQLVEMHLAADNTVTLKLHPIDGVPDGLDTEGLAWLGGNRFAISTEGQNAPTASVLYAELRPGTDHLVVTRERPLTDADLGVTLAINKGAEGACGAGDDVLIGIESVGRLPDGTRWAPIARLRGEALTVGKLRLTTETGKVSSLDCTIDPDGTAHVWAIERHYGVSKILRFTMPLGVGEITPAVAIDMGPILRDSLNLEGIIQLHDGRLVVINDNQGATIKGPTELLVFAPGAGTK